MNSLSYAAVTVIIWATMPAVSKLLVTNLPNFEVLFVSSLAAFIFLTALNYKTGELKKFNRVSTSELLLMMFFGLLGLFLYTALFYYGLDRLSSQEACVLNYLWVIFTVIFSSKILGERITRRKIFALLLSFGGVIVVMAGNFGAGTFSTETFFGALSCILAAACYALFSVLNKRQRLNQKITMMVIWFTVALLSFEAGIFFEEWEWFGVKDFIALMWLGIFINATAYLTWALALEKTKNTAQVANVAYLTPVLAIFVSTFLFDEELPTAVIPALILILIGIFIQGRGD